VQSADDGGCAVPGEGLIVQAYNPANADRTNADLSRGSIAIEPGNLYQATVDHDAGDTAHTLYSKGDFVNGEPGTDDFCNVGTMTAAEQDNLPYVPPVPPDPDAGPDAAPTPAIPVTTLKYDWKNVKVYVKPSSLGTELVGDLTTTTTTKDPDSGAPGTCTATYRVSALYPQIPCASFCDCLPYPDPDNGRATGSGINPDLFAPQPGDPNAACEKSDGARMVLEGQAKVTCNTDIAGGLCVLKGEPPN
jgi:hypothetical protein